MTEPGVSRLPFLPLLLLSAVFLLPPAPSLGAGPAPAAPSTDTAPLATFDAAWTAIRETYVDRARTEEEWARLHQEFRTRAEAAGDDEAIRQILRDLLSAIGRSHFELLPTGGDAIPAAPEGDDTGDLGLEVTPIDGEIVVTGVLPSGPADRAGLREGWVIEALDGIRMAPEASGAALKAGPARSFRLWSLTTALLRGPVGSRARLRVRDARDEVRDVDVTRTRQPGHPVKFGHLPTLYARLEHRPLDAPGGHRAHYLHFNIWMTAVSPAIDRAMVEAKRADGVVLDLRQNPGGVLAMLMGVSGHFLDEPVSLGTLRTRESELKLVANPRRVAPDGGIVRPYEGRLAILVDESSYSASEIFAAGMQAVGRARVFGIRTPGGALPAMLKRLPNGDVLEYAIGDFVTAAGEHVEGRGVIPDEEVRLTRRAALSGSDPPLEAALAWIGRGASESNPRASAGGGR